MRATLKICQNCGVFFDLDKRYIHLKKDYKGYYLDCPLCGEEIKDEQNKISGVIIPKKEKKT